MPKNQESSLMVEEKIKANNRTVAVQLQQAINELLDCHSLFNSNLGLNKAEIKQEVNWILSSAIDKPLSWLYSFPDTLLSKEKCEQFASLIERRKKGEPLAYILGEQPFWKINLYVNEHVLIPRSDTESLIEQVLAWDLKYNATILDLGTGSGAIALALAFESQLQSKNWQITAVDNSVDALTVAKKNKVKLNVSVDFKLSHWYSALNTAQFDLIISNPPYIAQEDKHLRNLNHEPACALVAGNNGLLDIAHIIAQAKEHLKPEGKLIIEHGFEQNELVQQLLYKFGFLHVFSGQDLSGNWRYTYAY